ncbi:hypothetical protein OOK31_06915 [Streptomyces sp. NBC_00249]|uniref:hypothetical protein n=1 Tax=Streptomyces sp. NBC_00249 TaxID=2975690 RepID=UPI00225A7CB2|nr:hypothetical protein [Streptomyces sp. NBC_00249]MCX5193624.1 hypothetical protein [Streptomyces sp. NBC_00249]
MPSLEAGDTPEAPEPEAEIAPDPDVAPTPYDAAPEPPSTPEEPQEHSDPTEQEEPPDPAEAPEPPAALESDDGSDAAPAPTPDTDEAPDPWPASDDAPEAPEPAADTRTVPGTDDHDEAPDPTRPDEAPHVAEPSSDAAPDPDEAPAPHDAAPEPQEHPATPEPAEPPHHEEELPDPDEAPEPPETLEQQPAGESAVAPTHDADEAPDPPASPGDTPEVRAEPSEPADPDSGPAPDASEPRPSHAARDDVVEGGFMDQMKQMAGVGKHVREQRERLTNTVDRPEFQDPSEYPEDLPNRYGAPLDRSDGTRTPLFDGEPSRKQAKQGAINDCGIVATLGAVAEHRPEAIRACVQESEDGNYQVKLHEAKYNYSLGRFEPTGRKINLTVTPDLPVFDATPEAPAFADSVGTGAAWAPIMEKAVAGIDQTWTDDRRDQWASDSVLRPGPPDSEGYVRLNKGSSAQDRAELLTQLTGRPAHVWDFPDKPNYDWVSPDKQLVTDIRQQLADGKPVLVGSCSEKEAKGPLENDLHPEHAYEVTHVDEKGQFHLHNPWHRNQPDPLTIRQFRKNIRPRYTTLE